MKKNNTEDFMRRKLSKYIYIHTFTNMNLYFVRIFVFEPWFKHYKHVNNMKYYNELVSQNDKYEWRNEENIIKYGCETEID